MNAQFKKYLVTGVIALVAVKVALMVPQLRAVVFGTTVK